MSRAPTRWSSAGKNSRPAKLGLNSISESDVATYIATKLKIKRPQEEKKRKQTPNHRIYRSAVAHEQALSSPRQKLHVKYHINVT